MRKLFVLVICILLFSGCTSEGETVTCTINDKEAVFKIKEGIISSYTLDGKKQPSATVSEINGEYFTSSTTLDSAKQALKVYVQTQKGYC